MMKSIVILLFVGACLAFPADEELKPPSQLSPESIPLPPSQEPNSSSLSPDLDQTENPDTSDLKTDNTFWWRRSYYPSYRSWYRPYYYKTYSYYTPRVYYSGWW